ncbi:MAG: sigma-70 family RNA polymerase sigma factor [Bacteroidia bacterium]
MSDTTTSSDEELMRQVAERGSHAALSTLYARHHRSLLHFFYRGLGDSEQAQDFLQELFLKLAERPERYEAGRSFRTWVLTIAANMLKNEYRRRSVRARPLPQLSQTYALLDDEASDRSLWAEALQAGLQELSDAHREVILLRYQQELSLREIGEIVQCAEGTVKSRIFYALQHLAARLGRKP